MEMLAVAEIQTVVGLCPRLQPLIDANDKTPFTDGHIDVYSGKSRKKADHVGRVAVQVKGRAAPKRKSRSPSFQISRTDLLVFQRDGGVLYFVVHIDPKTGDRTPYHALLTPFKIVHLLDQVPESQSWITVPLTIMPDASDEIERIVHLALKGQAQNPSLGVDPVLFEKMQSINVFTARDLDLSAPIDLTPGEIDFVLEMTTAGGSVVPLSGDFKIVPSDYLAHDADLTIRAGAVTYDQISVRRIDTDSVEVLVAEGLALVMSEAPDRRKFDINLTPQSNFAARLKALEFFMGIVDHGTLAINEREYKLSYDQDVQSEDRVTELREHLAYLHGLRDLFVHLGAESTLVELDDIDDSQAQNLLTLHRAFVQGQELTNKDGKTSRSTVAVGNWGLMILVVPGKLPHRWRFVDPFHSDTRQLFRLSTVTDDQEPVIVTVYDVIEKEQLPTLLNLRLESIIDAYEAISDFENTMTLANLFMLNLISAADASPARKEEFLQAARTLNEWIIAREGEEPIHLVNKWQIEWRGGLLGQSDKNAIRDLKREMSTAQGKNVAEVELACALLLDDVDEATYLADRLPDEQVDKMKDWPIWRLREQLDGAVGAQATDSDTNEAEPPLT